MYGLNLVKNVLPRITQPVTCRLIQLKNYVLLLIRRQGDKICKTVIVDYITDTKQVNELYKAVQYFLSTDSCIDYTRESPLKLTYDKKIETLEQLEVISLNKFVPQYQSKKFNYKGYEICYNHSKETITVYADKERKRENYTITLSTMIPKDTTTDILDEFCGHCMIEYTKTQLTKKWVQQIFINKEGVTPLG
jgi:hypothetical protein